jgi:hypothetical protein
MLTLLTYDHLIPVLRCSDESWTTLVECRVRSLVYNGRRGGFPFR